MSIEKKLGNVREEQRAEALKAEKYIDNGKPFKFIDYIINKYNVHITGDGDLGEGNINAYNVLLDDYNFYREQGVVGDLTYTILKRFSDGVVKSYYSLLNKEDDKK